MSHLFFYIQLFFILLPAGLFSQKKWDGGGGDDAWNNAFNWSDDAVPDAGDAIVLDNSVIHASYTVTLPPGDLAVTVKSIAILPSPGNTVELVLPETNTVVPGLTITGPGYGLDIGSGGVFRNASGASSGAPASIADSIRIRNGGRFIHNTQRAHAANVQVLSAAPGTETGIMEFDVPAVSSTISLSGRTFGRLVLKATAMAGGATKYTAAGTNGVRIRDDLEIDGGVTCGLNFSDTIMVDGNFFNDGIVDLGNTARSVVLAIKKDITQTAPASITETGTGSQQVLLNGTVGQNINIQGSISNDVRLHVDCSGNILLTAPLVLNNDIFLVKGVVNTSDEALLTLGPASVLHADTLAGQSFINGPLRKTGLDNSDFVFPVGKENRMRWLALKNATGDFTVEYFQADPHNLNSNLGTGLDHLSQLEYWNIGGSGSSGNIRLSFASPGSGGVTDLADLRVARLTGGAWQDEGNNGVGGSAGADGWVSSFAAGGFSAGNNYFALASAIGQENPLPLTRILLRADRKDNAIRLTWNVISDASLRRFEVQRTNERKEFATIGFLYAEERTANYSYDYYAQEDQDALFRIKTTDDKGNLYYSNALTLRSTAVEGFLVSGASSVGPVLGIIISAPRSGPIDMGIFNSAGRLVERYKAMVSKGAAPYSFYISILPAGIYYLKCFGLGYSSNAFRFRKQ